MIPLAFEIPWAGIGGFLLGLGSAMSGWAALVAARKKAKDDAREGDPPAEP